MVLFGRKAFISAFFVMVCSLQLSLVQATAGEITVITSDQKTINVSVTPEKTIMDVKQFIFDVTQVHMQSQTLYKGNQILKNDKTLSSYGIKEGDTLYVTESVGMNTEKSKSAGGTAKIIIIIILAAAGIYVVKKMFFTSDKSVQE